MRVPRLRTIWRRTILSVCVVLVVTLAALPVSKLIGRYRLARAKVAFAEAYGSADPSDWETYDDQDQDNAARLLRAGVLALQIRSAEIAPLVRAVYHPATWTEAQRQWLADIVERNQLALALFHKAADVPLSVYGSRCAADESAFPPWWTRQASQLLAGEALLSYERGDRVAALHSIRAITRLASSLAGEGPMINYLIGLGVESEGMLPLFHWAQHSAEGEAAFLAGADAAVPSLDLIAQLRRARGFEALCFGVDSLTRCSESGLDVLLLWPTAELTQAKLLQVATDGARLINTDVPLIERMAVLERDSLLSGLWSPSREAETASLALNGVVVNAVEALAQRQLLHAAFQVRILGLANGAYPSGRPELAPLSKPEPISGQPLVYSVQADGTAVVTCVDTTLKAAKFKPKRVTLPRIE